MTDSLDPSGMKVLFIQPGKEPRPAEMLAEGQGKAEWTVKEGSSKYKL